MSPETTTPAAPATATTPTPSTTPGTPGTPVAPTAPGVPGVLAATTVLAVAAASLATVAPATGGTTHEAPDAPGSADAPASAGTDADTPLAAWTRVLDELAELSAGAGPDAGDSVIRRLVRWTPPTDLGPLPAELVDRALDVLSGQAHVVEHLHQAVAENRRHARAVSTVPVVSSNPPAAYLDVQA